MTVHEIKNAQQYHGDDAAATRCTERRDPVFTQQQRRCHG